MPPASGAPWPSIDGCTSLVFDYNRCLRCIPDLFIRYLFFQRTRRPTSFSGHALYNTRTLAKILRLKVAASGEDLDPACTDEDLEAVFSAFTEDQRAITNGGLVAKVLEHARGERDARLAETAESEGLTSTQAFASQAGESLFHLPLTDLQQGAKRVAASLSVDCPQAKPAGEGVRCATGDAAQGRLAAGDNDDNADAEMPTQGQCLRSSVKPEPTNNREGASEWTRRPKITTTCSGGARKYAQFAPGVMPWNRRGAWFRETLCFPNSQQT